MASVELKLNELVVEWRKVQNIDILPSCGVKFSNVPAKQNQF